MIVYNFKSFSNVAAVTEFCNDCHRNRIMQCNPVSFRWFGWSPGYQHCSSIWIWVWQHPSPLLCLRLSSGLSCKTPLTSSQRFTLQSVSRAVCEMQHQGQDVRLQDLPDQTKCCMQTYCAHKCFYSFSQAGILCSGKYSRYRALCGYRNAQRGETESHE